ncbi:hypothetical protein [Nocardia puris]|uniref:Uncharacterized protein n=1 Tax=Nocardia puris TaxID=208602 RepID=A0A366DPX5_9NOCA|nr:hypothetical protein [Nocardia puris]RBO91324.1 hypothetical protein DFR74_10426 [Nocardia puris]
MTRRIALHTDASFQRHDGTYVVLVEDGQMGYSEHNGPWASPERAEEYVREQNALLGLSELEAYAIYWSSHTGRPAAEWMADATARPESEVQCAHGGPISAEDCLACAEQVRVEHVADLVGITSPGAELNQILCRSCGCRIVHRVHIGTPIWSGPREG